MVAAGSASSRASAAPLALLLLCDVGGSPLEGLEPKAASISDENTPLGLPYSEYKSAPYFSFRDWFKCVSSS
jgi:hypothetical protein